MAVQDFSGSDGFPCKHRGVECSSMPTLIDRMDVHHQQEEERKFKCGECGRGYRHAGSLTNHKKTHEVGCFQCTICGKENFNASALKSHLRNHTSFKKYSCLECGKAFRLSTQLATHERVHLAQRAKEESCRKLDSEFSTHETKINRQFHELPESVGIPAEMCRSQLKTEDDYNLQSESCEDSANRPFRCDSCDKSYIHHRSLINHKKTHQVGMFECTVCPKVFNNMAALYSHQRTHRSKSGTGHSLNGESRSDLPLDQFSSLSCDAPVNFCHLCQVAFPGDEEFQKHIQIHNASSLSYGVQDHLPENQNISYSNGAALNEPNFYSLPTNDFPPMPSLDNSKSFDLPENKIKNTANVFPDCSFDQKPFSFCHQSLVVDQNIHTSTHMALHSNDNATKTEEAFPAGSDERPFKCQTCGKSYRHSGSLINHKRSHQVGTYQCSVCGKSYPHLAALKSHLRLHKAQQSSFDLSADGDWLSDEPLTLDDHQTGSSLNAHEDKAPPFLAVDPSDQALYQQQIHQDFSEDAVALLPHTRHPMTQRHMCADCGETFQNVAGIKSHSCLLLPDRYADGSSSQCGNDRRSFGDSESDGFDRPNGGRCHNTERNFHDGMNCDQLDSGRDDDDDEDEDEDLCHCSVCGNNYTSLTALRNHLRGHTQSDGNTASSGPSSMSSHEEVKDERDDDLGETIICSTCGESLTSRQDLVTHHLLHQDGSNAFPTNGKEEEQIICGLCGFSCVSYEHLDNHGCAADRREESVRCEEERREKAEAVRETAADRLYRCDLCGRSYRHAGSLLNHKKSHKTGVFRCLICQKRFYNLLALKNHQRSHFDVKRYSCHECGKAFKIQKQLLIHLKRHKRNQTKTQRLGDPTGGSVQTDEREPNEKPPSLTAEAQTSVRCRGPKAEANSSASGETGDPRPFACDQCGRTYRHAGSLVNHRNSHKTGEYHCSVCDNTYSNQLAMKNHLRTHVATKKHSCQNCGRGFRGKKQLSAHLCSGSGKKDTKFKIFRCKQCKRGFVSGDQLAGHTCAGPSRNPRSNTGSDKEERPFRCNVCSRSYRHAGSLLNHKNTHKTGNFSCSFCSKPFTNPMALRNHTRIHTQKKKYACPTCGKAFRLASVLHNHQKVHNRTLGHFSCASCGKSFQGRSGLKRHRCRRGQENISQSGFQCSESGDKCFKCDLCGRSYRHAGSLLNHKKSHSENLHHCALCLQTFPDPAALQTHSQMRRHCCPECGKTFCLVSHLQSHMDAHAKDRSDAASYQEHQDLTWDSGINQAAGASETPLSHIPDSDSAGRNIVSLAEEKSHVCEHCGRAYRHAGSLLNHKNSHKVGSFSCAACQKEFTNLMALKNHRRIHTEPKRYQCQECGKAFRVSTQLICHRRIHTKEKPFSCPLCDKNFSSKSNLRHHQKLHQNSSHTYDSSFSVDADAFMDLDIGSFL